MISWLLLVLRALTEVARSRVSLAAENAILRQKLSVLQREQPRPLLRPADLVAGPNWAGLFWFRPTCRVLTPTGQEMSLPVTR